MRVAVGTGLHGQRRIPWALLGKPAEAPANYSGGSRWSTLATRQVVVVNTVAGAVGTQPHQQAAPIDDYPKAVNWRNQLLKFSPGFPESSRW